MINRYLRLLIFVFVILNFPLMVEAQLSHPQDQSRLSNRVFIPSAELGQLSAMDNFRFDQSMISGLNVMSTDNGSSDVIEPIVTAFQWVFVPEIFRFGDGRRTIVNNNGSVIGTNNNTAWYYDQFGYTIDTQHNTIVWSINNFGIASGYIGDFPPLVNSEHIHRDDFGAFRWNSSPNVEPFREYAYQTHINDHDVVAGINLSPDGHNGLFTDPGGNVAGTNGLYQPRVNGINNRGHIVVHSFTQSGNGLLHIIRDGSITNYGNLGTSIEGGLNITGFNNRDQVLYFEAARSPSDDIDRSYLFEDGEITQINSNELQWDSYHDLNNAGQIVGEYFHGGSGPQRRAILLQDGKYYELTELAADFLGDNQVLTRASGISQNGWIVGNASRGPASRFLLKLAVPEIYWEDHPDDDQFANMLNWLQVQVPGPANAAVFDTDSDEPYSVEFAASGSDNDDDDSNGFGDCPPYCVAKMVNSRQTPARLIVRDDDVTLNLNENEIEIPGNLHGPGLTVGESEGDDGKLSFKNGTLHAVEAVIGVFTGSKGELKISESSARMNSLMTVVGIDGTGKLELSNSAKADINSLIVNTAGLAVGGGLPGKGDVEVKSGAKLEASSILIGDKGKLKSDELKLEPLSGQSEYPEISTDGVVKTPFLYISGGGKVEPDDTVSVKPGATLAGFGKIEESVINSGHLDPGMVLDSLLAEQQMLTTFTIDGDYIQKEDGTLFITLSNENGDLKNDALKVNGDAKLSGALVLSLTLESEILNDGRFLILEADSVSGEFDGFFGPEGFPDFHMIYDSNRVYIEIGEVATTIAGDEADQLPNEIGLYQNYPNPFNPSTTIRFALPERSNVRLEVYSMLGQRVAVLADENKQAGFHQVEFNASGLASGTYIYRMTAGEEVISRKLTLIK
ncbi:T9SS type A sorting domain-containing protein [Rhodohalobacter sp. SW132]|uniref:T9SS type A sorting domain-containing protein n=1 Tax=Rhodohalobacter sp. SW132 TaxID=2293433 RepID=UPI001F15B17C|nr:T9SS type A sorting domain-containing protein [Rhodohalobacter sp. SW132]